MAKFQPIDQAPAEIIANLKSTQKQADATQLLELHCKITGLEPVVWHPGIIGFGQYRYQYETGHSGIAPLVAFAPRQAKISLYLEQDFPDREKLLSQLGKFKRAVGCIYVNKLADIDVAVLEELIRKSFAHTKKRKDLSK